MRARVAAAGALRADRHTATRALFMVGLPKLGQRVHERLLNDLSRRVTQ